MKRQIYLDTDIVGKIEVFVGMHPEVICYGNWLGAIAHREHGLASTSGAQFLDYNSTIPTSMGCLNSHVGDKLLQTNPVSVRKAACRRECRGIVFLEKLHEKTDQWSWPVHYSGSDVDIKIHPVFGRTDGLEVSPP